MKLQWQFASQVSLLFKPKQRKGNCHRWRGQIAWWQLDEANTLFRSEGSKAWPSPCTDMWAKCIHTDMHTHSPMCLHINLGAIPNLCVHQNFPDTLRTEWLSWQCRFITLSYQKFPQTLSFYLNSSRTQINSHMWSFTGRHNVLLFILWVKWELSGKGETID